MDQRDLTAIAAILICTLLNFCFSLAETALVSMSSSRLMHPVRDESESGGIGLPASASETVDARAAESIRWLLSEPTRVVAAVQIGLTVFSLTSAAVAVAVLAPDFALWLHTYRVPHDMRVAAVVSVLLTATLTLVVGEIIPRAIALRYPERVALLVAGPLRWIERAERPIVAVILGLSNLLIKPFGMSASFQAPVITEEELRTMLEASSKEGVIQEDEKEMLHNVITFGDTLAHKVMTPRVHVKAIEVRQPLDKLINLIVDHGHSRIPVYDGTTDSIIGVIHAKDLLPSLAKGQTNADLRSLMRVPFFVPEQMRTDDLLDEMRRSNMQLAIVQDEYGGTAGLITIEDLVEEIVGEIRDEYDVEQPMILIEPDSGAALVDARMSIDDVNDKLGLALPTTDFDTVGGFVFGLFGRPPTVGESIDTEAAPDHEIDVRFTITKADGRRLQQLRIETVPSAESAADAETQSSTQVQSPAA